MADRLLDISEADLRSLSTAIQARIEALAASASAASADLEALFVAACADYVATESSDCSAPEGVTGPIELEARRAEIGESLSHAFAAKSAALEAELVAADEGLEQLQGLSVDGGNCAALSADLLARFGVPPLVPAEPAVLRLLQAEGAALASLCAPRGVVASDLALGAVPRVVRVRSEIPAAFTLDVVVRPADVGRDAAAVEGRRVVVESVCARLRASASLVCSPCADASPDPLPLAVSCAQNSAGDGVCVSVALPDPLPPSVPGSTWALRVDRLALGGASLLSPESSLASPVPVIVDRRPPPGPVRPAGELFDACRRCNLADARRVMSGPPDAWSTEETDERGYTCVLIIAYLAGGDEGRLELLEALLDAGADVNAAARHIDGRTALHCAAYMGRCSLLAPLVEAGAVIDAPDREGKTPVDWAVKWSEPKAAALLRDLIEGRRAVPETPSAARPPGGVRHTAADSAVLAPGPPARAKPSKSTGCCMS